MAKKILKNEEEELNVIDIQAVGGAKKRKSSKKASKKSSKKSSKKAKRSYKKASKKSSKKGSKKGFSASQSEYQYWVPCKILQ